MEGMLDSSSLVYLPLRPIESFVYNSRPYVVTDKRTGKQKTILTFDDMKNRYKHWVRSVELASSYDGFFSHRWDRDRDSHTSKPSAMVSACHDALMEHVLPSSSSSSSSIADRSMVVFMDVHRLQSAQDFQVQFSTALRLSRVVVVFLTAAALKGPMTHNGHMETEEDNCLIEWLLALFYEGYGKIVDRHKQTQTHLPFHTDGKQRKRKMNI